MRAPIILSLPSPTQLASDPAFTDVFAQRPTIAQDFTPQTFASTSAEEDVISVGIPTDVGAGDVLFLQAQGRMLNNNANAGGNVTVTPRVYVDDTLALFGSSGLTIANNTSSYGWLFQLWLHIAGSASSYAFARFFQHSANSIGGLAGAASGPMDRLGGSAEVTEDLSVAKNLRFTAQMDISHAQAQFTVRTWALQRFQPAA